MIFNHEGVEIDILDKSELVKGQMYRGMCVDSSTAIWSGREFKYLHFVNVAWCVAKLNHPEDGGNALFLPIRKLNIKEIE